MRRLEIGAKFIDTGTKFLGIAVVKDHFFNDDGKECYAVYWTAKESMGGRAVDDPDLVECTPLEQLL